MWTLSRWTKETSSLPTQRVRWVVGGGKDGRLGSRAQGEPPPSQPSAHAGRCRPAAAAIARPAAAAGDAPLHLTPNWLHPKSNYDDFFGGLLAITPQQFRRVNGFGTQYWGWGREDDNLAKRLQRVPGAVCGVRCAVCGVVVAAASCWGCC